MEDGAVRGYGIIRRGRTGFKLGPLFAETAESAETLSRSLAAEAGHVELPEGEAWRFNAGALPCRGIEVGDDDVGAFTREAMSDGQSDPTSSAGDQRCLAFKTLLHRDLTS